MSSAIRDVSRALLSDCTTNEAPFFVYNLRRFPMVSSLVFALPEQHCVCYQQSDDRIRNDDYDDVIRQSGYDT